MHMLLDIKLQQTLTGNVQVQEQMCAMRNSTSKHDLQTPCIVKDIVLELGVSAWWYDAQNTEIL